MLLDVLGLQSVALINILLLNTFRTVRGFDLPIRAIILGILTLKH
jgi:hypothetical protein